MNRILAFLMALLAMPGVAAPGEFASASVGEEIKENLPRPTEGLRRLTTEEIQELLAPRKIVCRKPTHVGGRSDLCTIYDTGGRYLEINGLVEGTYIVADAEVCNAHMAKRLPTRCFAFYIDESGALYRTKTKPGTESDARPIIVGLAPLDIGPRTPER